MWYKFRRSVVKDIRGGLRLKDAYLVNVASPFAHGDFPVPPASAMITRDR